MYFNKQPRNMTQVTIKTRTNQTSNYQKKKMTIRVKIDKNDKISMK